MSKSGLADSPFFAPAQPKAEIVTPPPAAERETVGDTLSESSTPEQTHIKTHRMTSKRDIDNTTSASEPRSENHAGLNKGLHASNNASLHASKQSLIQESIIETIRKAVKVVGKDSATYRFTPDEKKALLELSFSYKMQGYKTSENELTRIAINFLLEDQKQNGRNSILQRVLDALSK